MYVSVSKVATRADKKSILRHTFKIWTTTITFPIPKQMSRHQ